MDKPRDPIGFELFKNTLLSIADEMALTILRTAYSGVLKDNMDYSTAFCDRSGRTIAQGLTLPAHLSSFPDALAATIARFGDRMRLPISHPGLGVGREGGGAGVNSEGRAWYGDQTN